MKIILISIVSWHLIKTKKDKDLMKNKDLIDIAYEVIDVVIRDFNNGYFREVSLDR